MFKGDLESLDHLLFHSEFARGLQDLAFIYCVTSNSILSHLFACEGFFGRKVKKKMAMVLPQVIL